MTGYVDTDQRYTIYQCSGCGRWFSRPANAVSCTVLHLSGCCHYGEAEVEHSKPRKRHGR